MQFPGFDPERPSRGAAGSLRVSEARPSVWECGTAGRGEPDLARQPFQQRSAELAFQGLDLVREPGLAHV